MWQRMVFKRGVNGGCRYEVLLERLGVYLSLHVLEIYRSENCEGLLQGSEAIELRKAQKTIILVSRKQKLASR